MDEKWESKGRVRPSLLPSPPSSERHKPGEKNGCGVWAYEASRTLEWPQSSRELLDTHGLCGQEGGTDASLSVGRLEETVVIWVGAFSKS